MGRPFAEFIQGVSDDYLLSKIAQRVPDAELTIRNVRLEIVDCRKRRRVTKEEARKAWDAVDEIESECSADGAASALLWQSPEISKVEIEWCDMTTTSWDRQAVAFVERVWPKFVESLAQTAIA